MAGSLFESAYRSGVAAVAIAEEPGHAADSGDAHTGEPMNLPVGQATTQPLHDGPSVRHCLQLRRCAQIAKEGTAFLRGLQCGARLRAPRLDGFSPQALDFRSLIETG